MSRWKITSIPPNRLAIRMCRRLDSISLLLPPRIFAAVFSTFWNRWCTARRFQSESPCVFGCSSGEDCIEHYACCKHTVELARRGLGIPECCTGSVSRFLLVGSEFQDDRILIKGSLCIYSVNTARNAISHGRQVPQHALYKFLLSCARFGVRGHRCASQAFAFGDI